MQDFFPLRIVTGASFCNRHLERKGLKKNLEMKRHTILVSPRRYGKTSLTSQVFEELSEVWVHGSVDFLVTLEADDVEKALLALVGQIIPKLIPTHKNLFDKVRSFFSFAQAKLVFSEAGPSIEFTQLKKPQQTIIEALMGLDQLAGANNKQVALLLDEFQQVGQIKDAEPIEAAIRHAAERAKNVCYIFSGSNRHLLSQMFDDNSRPLYHLCTKLIIERIEAKEYHAHLIKFAKMRWHKIMERTIIDHILFLTKCHPYYVNLLCSRLWDLEEPPHSENEVEECWLNYISGEKGRMADEITHLTLNQRKILMGIARDNILQPTNKAFLKAINLSLASAAQSVKTLMDKDMIYRDKAGILRLVDPSLEYFLQRGLQN